MSRQNLRRSTSAEQNQARSIITIVDHPVLADALRKLREETTQNADFRRYAGLVAQFLLIEATKQLPMTTVTIKTPLTSARQRKLKSDVVYFVAILRAGLALWLQDFLPKSRMSTIGVVRDEATLSAATGVVPTVHVYQEKFPREIGLDKKVIVLDPMLASGETAVAAIDRLQQKGVEPGNITFVCVIASVYGVLRLHQAFPKVKIIGAALDNNMTRNWYIYPGLGDFGCRFFGTDDTGSCLLPAKP